MKNIILLHIVLLISTLDMQGQEVSDIGKLTFSEVKRMKNIEPCEITEGKALTYCVEGGHKLTYIFNNNILNGIMTLTAFVTKNAAENELEKEVNDFKQSTGMEPNIGNGSTMFYRPGFKLTVSYAVKPFKETFYLIHYVFNSIN